MRKITMKSTKSTSENGGSIRGKSEDRATNFSDADNDDSKINSNTEDHESDIDQVDVKKIQDVTDDKLSENEDEPAKNTKTKKAGKQRNKKGTSASTNSKSSGKKNLKRKKTTSRKPAESENEDETEYEVEKVVGKKKIGGKLHYLIRWKGYSAKYDSWEAENTLNCPDLIKEYLKDEKKFGQNPSRGKETVLARRTKRIDYREYGDENEDFLNDTRKRKALPSTTSTVKEKRGRGNVEEDTEEYEVDKILKVNTSKKGGREFLVRWKGYPESQATWEPEKNLNCQDLLDKFLEQIKAKESPTARKSTLKNKKGQTGRKANRRAASNKSRKLKTI